MYDEINDKGKRRNIHGVGEKYWWVGLSDRETVYQRVSGTNMTVCWLKNGIKRNTGTKAPDGPL